MFPKLTHVLAAALAALALTAPAAAQCITPDNLDGGPCCSPTRVKLPPFPGFKQECLDICGTSITTGPATFLPDFLSMGIGAWTDPTTYPGEEILRWNASDVRTQDGCDGTVVEEVFFGVTTLDGYPANQITHAGVGPTLPPIFVDQGNSIRRHGGLILNVPYLSSRILNLNH